MADYQLPSSFVGGMQGASNALSAWKLPQGVQSPILKQILPTPKPVPVDPNKSPEVFKKRFIEKHGDWVAEDGRKYSAIPAPEIVAKVIRKYGDGNTTDWIPYREFLPRPASPNDSLEYRLKQIESLSQTPKSQFYTTGWVRWQTTGEKQFTTQVTNREKENEFVKTVKAPYRAVYNAMETPSQWLQMAVSDALNLIWADETSKNLTKQLVKDKFEQDTLNKDNKGLVWGIQEWSPSSIIGSLVTAIPNLLLYANPVGATTWIISTGGWLSLEWEAQWQTWAGDKAIAYSAGTISGLIDKISGQKFIDGLLSKGIKKEVAQWFVTKTKNFLKTLKPSDFEAGTEVIQQKIENWWRQLMGTEYDKGWKQYAEAGLMGKILGKVGDKWFSESPVTVLPPAPPAPSRVDTKNIETLQTIKIGKRANANVERNKSRWFDSYSDIATHQEIVPTVDKTGLVKTTEQVQNLEDTLDPINDALTQSIKDEWVLIPLDEFLIDSMNEAKQYENEWASYDRYVNQIRKDFEVYKRFTDAQWRIDLSKINEIKKAKYGISNFSDVESDKANKMVGKAAKELVEKYTKWESTKAINRELARWYSARDLLLAMDWKTVKGGRLWKMAARVGWNIIGSYFWPLGSFAGWEISAAVQWQMMKRSLKTQKWNIDSGDILSKIPKRTTPQLPPASQSSADKKVVLPVQSRPVSESVLPSQKLTVLSKKEVSWKKVNNSIIQKLKEKKNNIVEGLKKAKVDTELESLQKIQESMPWVPSIEVPKDYTPIGGLPTWTEFEAPIISSISKTKWKLPSPDVKRPQIRWFDLSTRSSMLESLKEQGMFTDSFFVVKDKNVSNKLFEYAEKKAIKKWNPTSGTKVDMKALVERAENGADTLLTPKEYMKLWKENGVYLRMDIWNWNQVAVNASYADIFFKNFDDVTFKWNNELSPVVVLSKWEPVWVIMPIKDVYSLKGKLGDFSMQSKTPQVEGKTVDSKKLLEKFTGRDSAETNLRNLEKASPEWWKIDSMKIDDIQHNIRADDFENLKESQGKIDWIIEKYKKDWIVQPIIVNKNWQVLDWNHRINAYKMLWLKEVPVYSPVLADLSKADNLATRLKAGGETLDSYFTDKVTDKPKPSPPKTPQVEGKIVPTKMEDLKLDFKKANDELIKKWVYQDDWLWDIEYTLWSKFRDKYGKQTTEYPEELQKYIRTLIEDTKTHLEQTSKPSLPLSQKSEVKYSKPDLASEAKKYKSAEDFVKAQWQTLYHWTNIKNAEMIKSKPRLLSVDEHKQFPTTVVWDTQIWISSSKEKWIAEYFASLQPAWKWEVVELVLPKNAKVYKLPDSVDSIDSLWLKKLQQLKKEWYDAIEDLKNTWWESEIRILSPEILKTRQQLTEIWNKANK